MERTISGYPAIKKSSSPEQARMILKSDRSQTCVQASAIPDTLWERVLDDQYRLGVDNR